MKIDWSLPYGLASAGLHLIFWIYTVDIVGSAIFAVNERGDELTVTAAVILISTVYAITFCLSLQFYDKFLEKA